MGYIMPARSCQKACVIAFPQRKEALCFCGEKRASLWEKRAQAGLAVIGHSVLGTLLVSVPSALMLETQHEPGAALPALGISELNEFLPTSVSTSRLPWMQGNGVPLLLVVLHP